MNIRNAKNSIVFVRSRLTVFVVLLFRGCVHALVLHAIPDRRAYGKL